ncbi:histidinol dehydrogenase [Pseudalkalibacillus berkeleyi]|uniref:Histidinol dehydrogenase n=1 Tax=Pseudalkalibacillus berkeleyi TaxID=1069813 RepID=A0ABS9H483_9BACL|nr:histidinol dehydrogenase [Pseudalkalibacillus berkeleyi]MCF6138693.1 histidinol dehydrogenase [Pseudalkalibacillus berkeleyi]
MKIQQLKGARIRKQLSQGTNEQREAVISILNQVKEQGDTALFELTGKFDGAQLDDLKVTDVEIEKAYASLDVEVIDVIREAAANIKAYHKKQIQESWITTKKDGTVLGQKVTPLDSVGVYVPGGTAAYPSSVLMGTIPASVAGVERIAIATPPRADGSISASVLVAANESGVSEIYKIGGAQAVGAFTFGTESVAPVDKIVGPGNIYVALAKREVFGIVGIDMIAGPSEIMIYADETAKPAYLAADLLSQAEHDQMATSILVTTSIEVAEETSKEVIRQLESLPRKEIAEASIISNGVIYIANTEEEAINAINEVAPEHLEIVAHEPFELLGQIKHAGAIFLGKNSSEPVGDYFAGPNHVLPTSGTARFSSPLGVDDFIKKSSIISYGTDALYNDGRKISKLARLEGLEAHARAIDIRLEEE